MIGTCFSAYANIAASVNTSQREDIRGVGILLYSGAYTLFHVGWCSPIVRVDMLKDESSEIDLVGPTLPSLKALLDLPMSTTRDSKERYGRAVHALISACLLNIDSMRGRDGLISLKKIKNNLLAAVLILTTIPENVKIGQAAAEHCCFLLSQKLLDLGEVSPVRCESGTGH